MDSLVGSIIILLQFAVIIVVVAGIWKMFTKAGYPGWAVLVPIYNGYVLIKIAGNPGWWLIFALIPIVNLILLWFFIPFQIAEKFGKNIIYALGLVFLPYIFYPWLGFGNARYRG